MEPISNVRKALGALVVWIATVATMILTSDETGVTTEEWIAIIGGAVSFLTVYVIRNVPAPDNG